MHCRNKLWSSMALAFGGALILGPVSAFAQAATPAADPAESSVQRVEVTGSSIRRTESEGALPVTTLTQADIKKTGAVSVTDLIQMLPSMQGFVPAAASVNGGGAGVTTAAVHSLPSKYTLVLLDGQRIAPMALGATQGGGFGVNLESIPLDAIERVEVLTDGASAVYGSDAIAGVVNFVLKKDKTNGDLALTVNHPQRAGGGSWDASISKGFGDLNKDGFNVMASFSHDHQDGLMASQRSFSRRGADFTFSSGGQNYRLFGSTGNTEPANITFNAVPKGSPAGTTPTAYNLNPYFTANGNCGSPLGSAITDPAVLGGQGVSCRFNYAATVQDIPKSDRNSGLLRASVKLGADTTAWANLSLSRYDMTAAFAPGAQPLTLSPTTLPALYDKYVQTYLDANNLALSGSVARVGYRALSTGDRTDDYRTDARHLALGIDGSGLGWDYRARLTLSHGVLTDTAAGGYADFNQAAAAVASGAYDPIMGTGASALLSTVLHTQFSKTTSDLNTLHVDAQHDLFALPGGESVVSLGADYSMTHYRVGFDDLILANSGFSTQPTSSDFPIGGGYGVIPFDASRNDWGASAEWLLPVTKDFEATLSGRYDAYSKVRSSYQFSTVADPTSGLQERLPTQEIGNTFNAATGKLSVRWTPARSVLLRGSYGTGFKAPNMSDIAGALTYAGSTTGSYGCPFPGSPGCFPGSAQYDVLAGANGNSGATGLKPEKSNQWTLGFRVEPVTGISAGADLWDVQIRHQVLSNGVAEQVGFANPTQYKSLFVNPYTDPQGFPTIGFEEVPFNGGVAHYRGIDWDVSYRQKTGLGNVSVSWTGTQMLKQSYNFADGQPDNSDLGKYGPDQQVVFRTISNLTGSLQTGAFTNTLVAHYKSGYHDEAYAANTQIYQANADGSLGKSVAFAGLRVPSYTTFDWQLQYQVAAPWQVTAGIKNLLNHNPPLSLQTGGGGNQVGYDGRYTDPIGRQFYLTTHYTF